MTQEASSRTGNVHCPSPLQAGRPAEPRPDFEGPRDSAAPIAEPEAAAAIPAAPPKRRYRRLGESPIRSGAPAPPSASTRSAADIARHERKCRICRHPARQAIDEEILEWHSPEDIAIRYRLYNRTTVYRHARVMGLYQRRRSNMRFILEHILESASMVQPNAHAVLRALYAYGRVSDTGVWTDTPAQIVLTAAPPAASVAVSDTRIASAAGQLAKTQAPLDPAPPPAATARAAVLIATRVHSENPANH